MAKGVRDRETEEKSSVEKLENITKNEKWTNGPNGSTFKHSQRIARR